MPTVDLRVFRCKSGYNATGEHVLIDAVLDEQRPMPVWVPGLLEVNALAAPLDRALTYRLKRHELNLVLSFLEASPAGQVAARISDLRAAARHIRSFVTESLGMGMLTATMRDFCRWNGNHDELEHFDALPPRISPDYLRGGVRPDLLYLDTAPSTKATAGEARGRSTKPSRRSAPLKAQRRRLDEILGWSARHKYHPVTMAWTCLGGSSLSVDFFHIEFPPVSQRRAAPPPIPVSPRQPPQRTNTGPAEHVPTADESLGHNAAQGDRADRSEHRRIRGSAYSLDREDEVRGLRANLTTAIEHLYRTAPLEDPSQRFGGIPVRGDWIPADLLGATRTQLFLGVLGEEPPAGLQRNLRESRLADPEAAFDPIQVDLLGRLIVGVALDHDAAPPWRDVVARLD